MIYLDIKMLAKKKKKKKTLIISIITLITIVFSIWGLIYWNIKNKEIKGNEKLVSTKKYNFHDCPPSSNNSPKPVKEPRKIIPPRQLKSDNERKTWGETNVKRINEKVFWAPNEEHQDYYKFDTTINQFPRLSYYISKNHSIFRNKKSMLSILFYYFDRTKACLWWGWV